MTSTDLIIHGRERDLGGFKVKRLLPYGPHRMVGPFIFFDHMGPAQFRLHEGMDVRPHPHIGLSTVTYLFDGEVQHRDSLGSDQRIRPGDINWMTAGRGIVHSERTPEDLRASGSKLNGLQIWVALPEGKEDQEPSFHHFPSSALPEFQERDTKIKLLLGEACGRQSPVPVHSNLFYLKLQLPKKSRFKFSSQGREAAAYLVSGSVIANDQPLPVSSMSVVSADKDLVINANENAVVMILGGAPVGTRHISWNFVSSSIEKIENAKTEWLKGPQRNSQFFQPIPGDQKDFVPLPDELTLKTK